MKKITTLLIAAALALTLATTITSCVDVKVGIDEDGHIAIQGVTFVDDEGNVRGTASRNEDGRIILTDVNYDFSSGAISVGVSTDVDGNVILDHVTLIALDGRISATASTDENGDIVLTELTIMLSGRSTTPE